MARKKRLDVNEVLDRERVGFEFQEKQNIYHTAGYIRLSIEDSGKTDGYSLENQEKLEMCIRDRDVAVDAIRRRFGFYAIQRGLMYTDRKLAALNAKEDNVVHPHGYMERGNRTGAYAG